MIVKAVLDSHKNLHEDAVTTPVYLYECDRIEIYTEKHRDDCGCMACTSYKNEKGGSIIKNIVCYKTMDDKMPEPEGKSSYRVAFIPLGYADFCYILNDKGQTVDKIIGW